MRLPRRTPSLLTIVLAIGVLLSACGKTDASAPPPSPQHHPGRWLLVLGDSLSTGFQPRGGGDMGCQVPSIDATGHGGWACLFLKHLQGVKPSITITNYAVNGEDTCSFVLGVHCLGLRQGYATPPQKAVPGSQEQNALNFLKSHKGKVSPITIELGANDLLLSSAGAPLPRTRARLRAELAALRGAAPTADIVVFDVFPPVAFPIPALTQLNKISRQEAARIHALFVDLVPAFAGQQTILVNPNDVHPTDRGQVVMAETIWRAYQSYITHTT